MIVKELKLIEAGANALVREALYLIRAIRRRRLLS